jgi:hypothetical protein
MAIFGRGRGRGTGYLGMPHNGMGRMQGEGIDAAFNTNLTSPASGNRVMSTLGPMGGPAGGRTSMANYGPVLEARRQARLGAMDAGLSTRGVRNAPGRGARPVTGGLETRGVRPAAGTRMAPPRRSISSLERRGARPGPGTRMAPAYNIGSRKPVAGRMGMSEAGRARINANLTQTRFAAGRSSAAGNMASINKNMANYGKRTPIQSANMAAINKNMANYGKRTPIQSANMAAINKNLKNFGKGAAEVGEETINKSAQLAAKTNTAKFLEHMKTPKGLLIGAGIIGMGAYLGNRRNRGTSSGAQGAYR